MRRKIIAGFIVTFIILLPEVHAQVNDVTAKGQHSLLGMTDFSEFEKGRFNPHPEAQWFPDAGLGLFIHWGMAAVHGGIDLSWGMLANKPWGDDGTVTPNQYYKLLNDWNPSKMNFDKIMKKAKAAGFKYAVFVTKHHDGFTFWPSEYDEIGTKYSFNGRDFVREYVEACRRYEIKVGFYYSPPDWYFDRNIRNWSADNSVWLDMDHKQVEQPPKPSSHDVARVNMVRNQVRELLTLYGQVDLIWFDGGVGEISNNEVRELQPGIVINGRNGEPGDYNSDSEGKLPEKRISGWHETCDPCWPSHWWIYSTNDRYDNASTVITNLVKMRAWGGNYLANLGPYANGTVPANVYQTWKEMAEWMDHSAESVFDIKGGNYPEKTSVPVTINNNAAYCFALPGYQGSIIMEDVKVPKSVVLLRTTEPVNYQYENGDLKIVIPAGKRTRFPDAVKVIW